MSTEFVRERQTWRHVFFQATTLRYCIASTPRALFYYHICIVTCTFRCLDSLIGHHFLSMIYAATKWGNRNCKLSNACLEPTGLNRRSPVEPHFRSQKSKTTGPRRVWTSYSRSPYSPMRGVATLAMLQRRLMNCVYVFFPWNSRQTYDGLWISCTWRVVKPCILLALLAMQCWWRPVCMGLGWVTATSNYVTKLWMAS